MPPDLQSSYYVFIRHDARHLTLQSLQVYEGPFCVIEKESKLFTIDFGNRTDAVFVDCLKPAQLDPNQPVQVAKRRRRGRQPNRSRLPHHDGSGGSPVVKHGSIKPSSLKAVDTQELEPSI